MKESQVFEDLSSVQTLTLINTESVLVLICKNCNKIVRVNSEMLSNLPWRGAVAADPQLEPSPNTPLFIVLVLNSTVLVRSDSWFVIISSCWRLAGDRCRQEPKLAAG